MSLNIISLLFVLALISIAGAQVQQPSDYIFESKTIPDERSLPSLANGHIGFLPYSDTLHLNGIYAHPNASRQARIPNYGRVQFEYCGTFSTGLDACTYSFDARRALFRTHSVHPTSSHEIELLTFAHRRYDNAVVNQLTIKRIDQTKVALPIRVRLFQSPGSNSADFELVSQLHKKWNDIDPYTQYELELNDRVDGKADRTTVHAIVQDIPEAVTLAAGEQTVTFTWIAAIGTERGVVGANFALNYDATDVLGEHVAEWQKFWSKSGITVEGNAELRRTIYSSLYTIASTQLAPGRFDSVSGLRGGVSPAGLGLRDYRGHSHWDAELWVQPVALLLQPQWSADMVQFRVDQLAAARANAAQLGYAGALFPLESGYWQGRDEAADAELKRTQHFASGTVAFGVRQHFFATLDREWLWTQSTQRDASDVCQIATETASFWDGRVEYDDATKRFELLDVTGPNANVRHVDNNAFTNVLAANNLLFGELAGCLCGRTVASVHETHADWAEVAKSLSLPKKDAHGDFTPAFDDFDASETVEQADALLLGYPLQYPLERSTQLNDLRIHEASLSLAAPSTSHAIENIVRLGLGVRPTDAQFERSFVPYVRSPYYVWTESSEKDALQPRVSASGAFVQQLLNGYAGIRLHDDRLEISENTQLPTKTTKLTVNGEFL